MFESKIEKNKIYEIFLIFLTIFTLLFIRLYYLTDMEGDKLSVMADSQYKYSEKNSELGYELQDRNGKALLNYIYEYYIIINPLLFNENFDDNNIQLKALDYILEGNSINIYDEKILSQSNLKKFTISQETYNKLKFIDKVKGIYYYREKQVDRKYAWEIENILSQNYDKMRNKLKDESSLEGQISSLYKDKNSTVNFVRDEEGYIKQDSFEEGPLSKLYLTLDKDIQENIRQILKETKYEKTGCILMETSTGNILALAQKNETLSNFLIGAGGEILYPGSTFKVLTAEAALENGAIKADEKFTCRGSLEQKHRFHGTLNLKEAMTVSCNDIFTQIGYKTGYEKIKEMSEKQGLLNKNLGLYDETKGSFEADKNISLTSIGQKIRITPLALLGVINTIANNGYYIEPHIIQNNNIKKEKVLKDTTVQVLKDSLRSAVSRGTGIYANNPKIKVYGKTGTTDYTDSDEDKSDGLFMGFFELDGKNYSMIVLVRDINMENEDGGSTAGVIFNKILNNLINEK